MSGECEYAAEWAAGAEGSKAQFDQEKVAIEIKESTGVVVAQLGGV